MIILIILSINMIMSCFGLFSNFFWNRLLLCSPASLGQEAIFLPQPTVARTGTGTVQQDKTGVLFGQPLRPVLLWLPLLHAAEHLPCAPHPPQRDNCVLPLFQHWLKAMWELCRRADRAAPCRSAGGRRPETRTGHTRVSPSKLFSVLEDRSIGISPDPSLVKQVWLC